MKKIITSVSNALRGLRHAYEVDKSFRMEVFGSVGFIVVGMLVWPMSGVDFIILTLAYFLIIITELINTAVEQLLERLHPERHDLIGKSKDIASAAVLVAFLFATVVVAVMLYERIGAI